jgi:hypothetical protein
MDLEQPLPRANETIRLRREIVRERATSQLELRGLDEDRAEVLQGGREVLDLQLSRQFTATLLRTREAGRHWIEIRATNAEALRESGCRWIRRFSTCWSFCASANRDRSRPLPGRVERAISVTPTGHRRGTNQQL